MTAMILALGAILLWSTLALLGLALSALPTTLLLAGALLTSGLPALWNPSAWRISRRTYLVGITGIFGYHFLYFRAFATAPAMQVNLINYLWPLLIVVLTPLVLKSYPLTHRHMLAALLGLIGSFLLVSGGTFEFAGGFQTGYLFALTAALTWALYTLFTRRLPSFPTASVSVFCLISGLLSIALYFFDGGTLDYILAIQVENWLKLLAIGIGPMGAAFYLWDAAIKRGDPRRIGILSYLTPLLSTLNLAIFAGKQITPVILISMVLIIAGSVLGVSIDRKMKAPIK